MPLHHGSHTHLIKCVSPAQSLGKLVEVKGAPQKKVEVSRSSHQEKNKFKFSQPLKLHTHTQNSVFLPSKEVWSLTHGVSQSKVHVYIKLQTHSHTHISRLEVRLGFRVVSKYIFVSQLHF